MWEQNACHRDGEPVVALATDPTNSFLVSGDALGYLKVWDVHQLTNAAGLDQKRNVIEVHHWRAHEGWCCRSPALLQPAHPNLHLSSTLLWALPPGAARTHRPALSKRAQAASHRLSTSRNNASFCPHPSTHP